MTVTKSAEVDTHKPPCSYLRFVLTMAGMFFAALGGILSVEIGRISEISEMARATDAALHVNQAAILTNSKDVEKNREVVSLELKTLSGQVTAMDNKLDILISAQLKAQGKDPR